MADGRRTFLVSLVTPDGAAFEGEAQMLIVPVSDGCRPSLRTTPSPEAKAFHGAITELPRRDSRSVKR